MLKEKFKKFVAGYFYNSSYEAARTGRRWGLKGLANPGPNLATSSDLENLRSRSRDSVRNDPVAFAGKSSYASAIAGSNGIRPRWDIEGQLGDDVNGWWSWWEKEADASGNTNFGGLLLQIAGAKFESGECLARFVPRRAREMRSPIPFQIELMESDHLPYGNITATKGNLGSPDQVLDGIEYSKSGNKRIAYHLYETHPRDTPKSIIARNFEIVRVPASEIMHVFEPLRPGAQRGVPGMASGLTLMHELDQLRDAHIVRSKTAAMFVGFIKNVLSNVPLGNLKEGGVDKSSGLLELLLEPGTIQSLARGEEIDFTRPPDTSEDFSITYKQYLHIISSSMRLPYNLVTGDLTQVNYSSIRSGNIWFKRDITNQQNGIYIPQFCSKVGDRFVATLLHRGLITPKQFNDNFREFRNPIWRLPKWDWVDPEKDINSEIKSVRAGFKTSADVILESGKDPVEVRKQRSKEIKEEEDLGLVFDTNPSLIDGKGGANTNSGETIE